MQCFKSWGNTSLNTCKEPQQLKGCLVFLSTLMLSEGKEELLLHIVCQPSSSLMIFTSTCINEAVWPIYVLYSLHLQISLQKRLKLTLWKYFQISSFQFWCTLIRWVNSVLILPNNYWWQYSSAMLNTTAWITSDIQVNFQFVQNILNIIFKADGLATMTVAEWNYTLILKIITHIAEEQTTQHSIMSLEPLHQNCRGLINQTKVQDWHNWGTNSTSEITSENYVVQVLNYSKSCLHCLCNSYCIKCLNKHDTHSDQAVVLWKI